MTLTTSAVEQGVTYESVLKRARTTLGDKAAEGVRCRITATGARLFEFPGAESAPVADSFAAKLRGVVTDVATVARPQKRTTVIVGGLDESVTAQEVVANNFHV